MGRDWNRYLAMADELDKAGHIYFLLDPLHGRVKIGRTKNLDARINSLKGMNAGPLELLGSHHVPDAHEAERKLHHQFHVHRVHHEWFVADPLILRAAKTLQKKELDWEDLKYVWGRLKVPCQVDFGCPTSSRYFVEFISEERAREDLGARVEKKLQQYSRYPPYRNLPGLDGLARLMWRKAADIQRSLMVWAACRELLTGRRECGFEVEQSLMRLQELIIGFCDIRLRDCFHPNTKHVLPGLKSSWGFEPSADLEELLSQLCEHVISDSPQFVLARYTEGEF